MTVKAELAIPFQQRLLEGRLTVFELVEHLQQFRGWDKVRCDAQGLTVIRLDRPDLGREKEPKRWKE